ncbi:MAG: UDP-N-acetylglucosamine--N-acetylmuramyl-(pentapeptide) pyrophosphoryl-undecaprenol N-acetylglucosamine transferase [Acidimicrobiia bacterium]|nr:UDP-N-acetylglucosamine--N-acetylmuramyl-(pentapeptide) pyrophosphoryl-undecaprenol N-acetylglucosamine transferase [Acidimicrobiia bacterium]
MTYLIAAAGTGGHVFPGLAVGEALVDRGVARSDILYVGGSRLESAVYPSEGYPFLSVEIRGLKRSVSLSNLSLPLVVIRARAEIARAMDERGVQVCLGMGGYVTIPMSLAAKKTGATLMIAEQNAHAGLANRLVAGRATRRFGSFPRTSGIEAEWVGNPVRKPFWDFDRKNLEGAGRSRYGLKEGVPTLGLFGGSLGARAINHAASQMLASWNGPPMQVVHLTGDAHFKEISSMDPAPGVLWARKAFEDSMEHFYAVSDLVVARAGGGVAELAATSTPVIVVPGSFGSAGHQSDNAAQFEEAGMAVVVPEHELDRLGEVVGMTLFDRPTLERMSAAAAAFARPGAAHDIADAMIGAAS